jgi:hypothetical protein
LPQSSLFMVGKAQKLHGVRAGLHGLMDESDTLFPS